MPDSARHDPWSAPFRHSKQLTHVSFRTSYSRVIPNVLLPCHSERSEESAVGNTAEGDAKLEEIPRRYAPRNDILKLESERDGGRVAGKNRNISGDLQPIKMGPGFVRPYSVIPDLIRNPFYRNETAEDPPEGTEYLRRPSTDQNGPRGDGLLKHAGQHSP
jgi:hypothetical protein